MEFFDSDPATESASGGSTPPPRRQRPPRRPPRQQLLARRGLALGGGLIILILLVLGVKGCLNARSDRQLQDYTRDVSQIVDETKQTSANFFGLLEDPGQLSVSDFQTEVQAQRGAVDGYLTRVQALSPPGDMSSAQNALELVYELRANAMNEISAQMPKALGQEGRSEAITAIAAQMQTLLASDVDYAAIVKPGIDTVLADNGITDADAPESQFLPNGIKWLDESALDAALGAISGETTATTGGSHGTGLSSVAVDGNTLEPDVPTTIAASTAPEVEVSVQNQGESDESDVTVVVTANGGQEQTQSIDSIGPGETGSVTIPLTPAPSGETQLEVKVEAVPGESIVTNNEATYTVTFQ